MHKTHRGICPNERETKGCHFRRFSLFLHQAWTALLEGVVSGANMLTGHSTSFHHLADPRWRCVTELMLHLGISIAKIGFSLYSCENTVSWTKNFNKKIINNKINNKKRKGKKEEEHFPFFNLKTKNNSKIVLKKKKC